MLKLTLSLGLGKRFIGYMLKLSCVNNTVPLFCRYIVHATNNYGYNVTCGSWNKEIQGPIIYLFVHLDAADNSKEK